MFTQSGYEFLISYYEFTQTFFTIQSVSQWAKNKYQKDSHFLICKCSENSEWQHFPLLFTIKTQYMTNINQFHISEPIPEFHKFLVSSCPV